jgi:hypothetical protein
VRQRQWAGKRTVNVGDDVYQRLRAHCIANNVTMESVVGWLFRDLDPAARPPRASSSPRWQLGREGPAS